MLIEGQVNSFRIYEIKRNTREISVGIKPGLFIPAKDYTEPQVSGISTDALLFRSLKASEIIHDY